MLRLLLLPCILSALFMIAMPVQAAESVHKGTVISAGENKITILDQDGENETFTVVKDAEITRNGKTAGLDDLDKGDTVKVTTKKVDGKEVAVKIVARAKE